MKGGGGRRSKGGVSIEKHRQNSGKLFCPDCQIQDLYTMNILYYTRQRFLLHVLSVNPIHSRSCDA